jgi:hypothetical protein
MKMGDTPAAVGTGPPYRDVRIFARLEMPVYVADIMTPGRIVAASVPSMEQPPSSAT